MTLSEATVTAMSAVFIALLALTVTIWQAALTRRHNRLSVRPHLRIDWLVSDEGTDEKVSVVLSNNGLGPAIIKRFQWKIDGKPLARSKEVPYHIVEQLG